MQADDWIVFSMSHRCELARVRCGGWRRQYAALITSPTTFTFAFYRDRKIHVQRRRDHVIESSAAGFSPSAMVMQIFIIFGVS